MSRLAAVLVFSLWSFSALASGREARPTIMLTGFWPPTNEMLREFSPHPDQNRGHWVGPDWEGRGYDVEAFFPEYPHGGEVGEGDFEVDYEHVRNDFDRFTAELKPVAIIGFGHGAGPWELETTFPDHWTGTGASYSSTLPVDAIASAVNGAGLNLAAWVDHGGDAGDFLCGFLGYLAGEYHARHADPRDPAWNIAAGFIHVGDADSRHPLNSYTRAAEVTLRALIQALDGTRASIR